MKKSFKIDLLRRRDYFKAKSSIGIQNRLHFTQSQIFFHDWWELVSNTFSERIFSNQILKRRQKTRFLPIKQLIVLHVEPPSIPSLKGIASSFEEIPFHIVWWRFWVTSFAISWTLSASCCLYKSVHMGVSVLKLFLQLILIGPHLIHLFIQIFEKIGIIFAEIGSLVVISAASVDVTEKLKIYWCKYLKITKIKLNLPLQGSQGVSCSVTLWCNIHNLKTSVESRILRPKHNFLIQ